MNNNGAPGIWISGHYVCSCNGCSFCTGHITDCTCDVDWDKVYGHE